MSARDSDRVERAEDGRVRAELPRALRAGEHLPRAAARDRERQREAQVTAERAEPLRHLVERPGAADRIVGRRGRAVEAHVDPHELALTELARDALVEEQPVRREARVQPVRGRAVDDRDEVLPQERLAARQPEAEAAQASEISEEAVHLCECEVRLARQLSGEAVGAAEVAGCNDLEMDRERPDEVIARRLDVEDHAGEAPVRAEEALPFEVVEEVGEECLSFVVGLLGDRAEPADLRRAAQDRGRVVIERGVTRRPPVEDQAAEVIEGRGRAERAPVNFRHVATTARPARSRGE